MVDEFKNLSISSLEGEMEKIKAKMEKIDKGIRNTPSQPTIEILFNKIADIKENQKNILVIIQEVNTMKKNDIQMSHAAKNLHRLFNSSRCEQSNNTHWKRRFNKIFNFKRLKHLNVWNIDFLSVFLWIQNVTSVNDTCVSMMKIWFEKFESPIGMLTK